MLTDVASQRHKTQRMNLDGGKLMLFLIRDREFSYCGRTLAAVIDICFSIEEWPKEKKIVIPESQRVCRSRLCTKH